MGFFDKFRKKKKQEDEDENLLNEELSAEQAEAPDGDIPKTGEDAPEQASETNAVSGTGSVSETGEQYEADEPEAAPEAEEVTEEISEETELPEELPQAEEAEVPEELSKEEETEEILEEESEDSEEEAPKKIGFFEKLKNGLKKTKDGFMSKLELLMNSFTTRISLTSWRKR